MKEIEIHAGSASYRALVGSGLLATIGTTLRSVVRGPRCALIADDRTAELFGETLRQSLTGSGFDPKLITVPRGESAKSLGELGRICDEMAAAGLDRTSFVVALGGGVVGDVAGFAAAIYHRGIAHVQVPTTLLAQVDSAIGGKTAVNTRAGKNLLGAVHQPALIVADLGTLETLPAREFKQGFAEIIKHAAIVEPQILDSLANFKREDLEQLVARNIAIKAHIVAADERDRTGHRAILNFGHTVGHAIERAAGYGAMLHGEAVALGIVAACEVSVRKAGLSQTERGQVTSALARFGLPTRLPAGFDRDEIMRGLHADKKFERGEIRFVVSPALGSAHLASDITLQDIAAAVAKL